MEDKLVEICKSLKEYYVKLGKFYIKLLVPDEKHPALFFVPYVTTHSLNSDYEFQLALVDTKYLPDISNEGFLEMKDSTFRANRFLEGFYLSHHFGSPAIKITRNNSHIVIGDKLEKIYWGYYIKLFLSLFALKHHELHLKASAVADMNNNISIIIGRGSGGKSVLTKLLIDHGLKFVSNTHILVQNKYCYSVNTAIRIRNDEIFKGAIDKLNVKPFLDTDEFIIHCSNMYADIVEGGIIKNIIISNYGYGRKGINKIDPKTSLIFMKNFSYPLHTYGMKDDYLEYLQYDVNVFAQTYNEEADMMKKLVDNSDNYICNLEDNDPRDLEIFVKQLVK